MRPVLLDGIGFLQTPVVVSLFGFTEFGEGAPQAICCLAPEASEGSEAASGSENFVAGSRKSNGPDTWPIELHQICANSQVVLIWVCLKAGSPPKKKVAFHAGLSFK